MPSRPPCFPREMEQRDQVHPGVQGFHCGDEPWAVEVADVLRGGEAWEHHNADKSKLTLIYFADQHENEVAGFICLDKRNIDLPTAEGGRRGKGFIIANVAVGTSFQGNGYLSAMLNDVVAASVESGLEGIMLLVDRRNTGAIARYTKLGFVQWGPSREEQGVIYDRMVLPLKIDN